MQAIRSLSLMLPLLVVVTVLHGCSGDDGSAGRDGLAAFSLVTAEPAGANCPAGGVKVTSGLDADGDGTLDPGEVTSTQFVCNGSSGAPLAWVQATEPSVQAAANTGYLANDPEEQVTITLPPSASLAIGDIIRVAGIAAGGWKVIRNPGQRLITSVIDGQPESRWQKRGPERQWRSVASSADGSSLVAVASGDFIYTSADSGLTWTPREEARSWQAVASSADGSKLVAGVNGGQIYTSGDFGVTWTPRDVERAWKSIASSADGSRLVAAEYDGRLYTSMDSGVSWTPREETRPWLDVTSSADGSRLAAVAYGGQLYTSTDFGVTWTPRDVARQWFSVASSAEGSRLVASAGSPAGQIYTSTDSGASWTARLPTPISIPFIAVTASADGTRLVACTYWLSAAPLFHISVDEGSSWDYDYSIAGIGSDVASSADGSLIVGTTQGGPIWVYSATTSISGGLYSALELQYIGNDRFMVLSHEGELAVE